MAPIAAAPDHASLYLLELYPNAPLRRHGARGLVARAGRGCGGCSRGDGASRRRQAFCIRSRTWRAPAASRHNLKYWTDRSGWDSEQAPTPLGWRSVEECLVHGRLHRTRDDRGRSCDGAPRDDEGRTPRGGAVHGPAAQPGHRHRSRGRSVTTGRLAAIRRRASALHRRRMAGSRGTASAPDTAWNVDGQ